MQESARSKMRNVMGQSLNLFSLRNHPVWEKPPSHSTGTANNSEVQKLVLTRVHKTVHYNAAQVLHGKFGTTTQ